MNDLPVVVRAMRVYISLLERLFIFIALRWVVDKGFEGLLVLQTPQDFVYIAYWC